jgi:hypothetical protein
MIGWRSPDFASLNPGYLLFVIASEAKQSHFTYACVWAEIASLRSQ